MTSVDVSLFVYFIQFCFYYISCVYTYIWLWFIVLHFICQKLTLDPPFYNFLLFPYFVFLQIVLLCSFVKLLYFLYSFILTKRYDCCIVIVFVCTLSEKLEHVFFTKCFIKFCFLFYFIFILLLLFFEQQFKKKNKKNLYTHNIRIMPRNKCAMCMQV